MRTGPLTDHRRRPTEVARRGTRAAASALHRLVSAAAGHGGDWWSHSPEAKYVGRKHVSAAGDGLVRVSLIGSFRWRG